ncbi:MAG TPA: PAAR domain-containing protein, partial [Isosphaeraceae bacterium]
MLFPAAKLGDTIVGLDFHSTTQTIVPPVPWPLFPHPFIGTIFLWHTPKWPMANVFVNGMPALTVGAKSYSFHIPLPPPAVPTPPPQITFKWWLTNVMTAGIAAVFSMVLNMIGSALGALTPTARCPASELPQPVENQSDWQKIQAILPVQSWLQLF